MTTLSNLKPGRVHPRSPDSSDSDRLPTVAVAGLPIHRVSMSTAVDHVFASLGRGTGGWVMTPNVDILRRWKREVQFRELTSDVTLCIADGMPLVWASRLLGEGLPERVTGADMTSSVLAEAAVRGRSVFFLGGAPGTAAAAAQSAEKAHPNLALAGVHFPPYGFEADEQEWDVMIDLLRTTAPDIIFVGLGSPKQEIVIQRLRHELPSSWWFGVGVTFSFLGGQIDRAPEWMQQRGLEWLFRLSREPRRLLRRYLIDDFPFAVSLLATSFGRGILAGRRNRKHFTRHSEQLRT